MIDSGGQGSSGGIGQPHPYITSMRAPVGNRLMLSGGALGEFSDDGQNVRLAMADLDHHEDGNTDNSGFENVVDANKMVRQRQGQRPHHPLHNQPGGKKIKTLKRMEPHNMVGFKFLRGKHNDRRNPADGRDVTQDGSSPGCQPRQRIGCRTSGPRPACGTRTRGPARLFGATAGAIRVRAGCLITALCTEGHSY